MVIYSVWEGQLLRTSAPSITSGTYRFGGSAGELAIGNGHAVADDLQRLELAPRPLLTEIVLTQRAILPGGKSVGNARPHAGYLGGDRAFGRLTVRYPGTGPLDVYADMRTLAAEAADTMGHAVPVEEREPAPA